MVANRIMHDVLALATRLGAAFDRGSESAGRKGAPAGSVLVDLHSPSDESAVRRASPVQLFSNRHTNWKALAIECAGRRPKGPG
jgi:hypothetical protein